MAISQEDKAIIKMTSAGDAITGHAFVLSLYWVSKSAVAGDDLLVSDEDGDTIWEAVADGTNFSQVFPVLRRIKGLTLTTRDSGTLYVVQRATPNL